MSMLIYVWIFIWHEKKIQINLIAGSNLIVLEMNYLLSVFLHRIQAKGYYIKTSIRKMVKKGSLKDFTRDIILEVDGKRVDLPQLEGIIILNILSWASGANLWGHEKDDKFNRPTHYDGMLEVVGVTGIVHLAQIQSGIRSGVRLAQGGHVRLLISIKRKINHSHHLKGSYTNE